MLCDSVWVYVVTDIQDDLVKKLHSIATEHQRHNVPIDLPAQCTDVDGDVAVREPSMVVKKLPGCVDLVRNAAGKRCLGDQDIFRLVFLDGHRVLPPAWTSRMSGLGRVRNSNTKGRTRKRQEG